jgi:hypothetical protein
VGSGSQKLSGSSSSSGSVNGGRPVLRRLKLGEARDCTGLEQVPLYLSWDRGPIIDFLSSKHTSH